MGCIKATCETTNTNKQRRMKKDLLGMDVQDIRKRRRRQQEQMD